jgi:serine/threonine protein kinase
VHADLKRENILVGEDYATTLIDLDDSHKSTPKNRGIFGSLETLSPDCFFEGAEHGTEKDMWAAGAVLFELATGRLLQDFLLLPEDRNDPSWGRLEEQEEAALAQEVLALNKNILGFPLQLELTGERRIFLRPAVLLQKIRRDRRVSLEEAQRELQLAIDKIVDQKVLEGSVLKPVIKGLLQLRAQERLSAQTALKLLDGS